MNIIKKIRGTTLAWWLMRGVTRRTTRHGITISNWHHLSPEQNATVQSFNSRSAGGFITNLHKLCNEGFARVMKIFYSGYGHKSIADCGSTTAALDGLSMLDAKAWQDWELYNGQETSTRYIDVTGLGYIDPIDTIESKQIMDRWLSFYIAALRPTIEHLKQVHPQNAQDAKKWATAIEKRAYDILGAFIPAGARTNASVHMTLRQWDDKIDYTIHHPVEEVRTSAEYMRNILKENYPSTFASKKSYAESEEYRRDYMRYHYLLEQERNGQVCMTEYGGFRLVENALHLGFLEEDRRIIEKRPKKTEMFKSLNEVGNYRLEFIVDYRSFRDLQRQRSATQRMPLLTMKLGFEQWYLDQLPEPVRLEAQALLAEQKQATERLVNDPLVRQYFIPMGYKVFTRFTFGLADLVYVIELRTPQTVHPTARIIAQRAYRALAERLPKWFVIYADMKPDELSVKRADHDLFIGKKRVSEL